MLSDADSKKILDLWWHGSFVYDILKVDMGAYIPMCI